MSCNRKDRRTLAALQRRSARLLVRARKLGIKVTETGRPLTPEEHRRLDRACEKRSRPSHAR